MRALLRKDVCELTTSLRVVWGMMILFFAVALIRAENSFFLLYLVILPSAAVTSLINIEEKSGWMRTAGMLPISRRQIVRERYLSAVLMGLLGIGTIGLCTLVYALRGQHITQPLLQILSLSLLAPALQIPVAYYFGTDRGRYVSMIILLGIMAFVMMRSDGGGALFGPVPGVGIFMAALVLFGLSYLLSQKIYERKEL